MDGQTKVEIQASINFYKQPYYRIPVILMSAFGLWKYQSVGERFLILTPIVLYSFVHAIMLYLTIVNHLNDWDYLVNVSTVVLAGSEVFAIFICVVINMRKVRMIFTRIEKNWTLWGQDCVVGVMHEYAEKGLQLVKGYAVIMCINLNAWAILPVLTPIMGNLLKNSTRPKHPPLPIDVHFIDIDKHYYYLIVDAYICCAELMSALLTFDSWLIVMVHHACGLFAAVRCKLQQVGINEGNSETKQMTDGTDGPDVKLEHLRSCIDRHNDAIEFSELVRAFYGWGFFMDMGINTLLIGVTLLQAAKGTVNQQDIIRSLSGAVFVVVHMYSNNYLAQMLMDHSTSIRSHLFNMDWYKLPAKTQKDLQLIALRCNKPCTLTAGKFSALSLETFKTSCNTALSYLMVLRTMLDDVAE